MNTQYPLNHAVMPFSWRRVMMTGRFYWPDLKKQVIWYPIITIVANILAFTMHGDNPLVIMIIGNIGILLQAMFVLAPLVISTREQRASAALLPISQREQFAFLAIYFMVAVPLVIFGIQAILLAICHPLLPESTFFKLTIQAESLIHTSPKTINGTMWLPTAVCLWGVMFFKSNRTLKSVLSTLGLVAAYTIGIIIYSIVRVLKLMPASKDNHAEAMATAQRFSTEIMELSTIIGYVSIGLTLVMLYLTYRAICNYQA